MSRPNHKRASRGRLTYENFRTDSRARSNVPKLAASVLEARVLIATCSGAARLSERYGRRLTLVRATTNLKAETDKLAAVAYGSIVLNAGSGSAFQPESGWDDWEQVRLTAAMPGGPSLDGVCVRGGELKVMLEGGATLASFQRALAITLRERRYDEFLLAAAAVASRCAHGLPIPVQPRYAENGGERIVDLVAFDPWTDLPLLLMSAAAALAIVCSETRS